MTGFAQVSLLNVERGVFEHGREDDERHFATGCAKVARTAKNSEMTDCSDHGKRGDASKNDLSFVVKHCCDKALYKRVLSWLGDERANPRTSAYVHMILIEQLNAGDLLVTELGMGRIADEG
jgi:hypothetical protein